jgi:NTP pyrophosphatase (non-canonical NTP hydrolase)
VDGGARGAVAGRNPEVVGGDVRFQMVDERRGPVQPMSSSSSLVELALKVFGTTKDPKEAGYIIPDGQMLDFSGKRQGSDTDGVRYMDHREVVSLVEGDHEGPTLAMLDFMQQSGSVRISVFDDSMIAMSTGIPTEKQRQRLASIVRGRDFAVLEITDADGYTVFSEEIEPVRGSDVAKFYDEAGGDVRFSDTRFSEADLAVEALSRNDRGRFNKWMESFKKGPVNALRRTIYSSTYRRLKLLANEYEARGNKDAADKIRETNRLFFASPEDRGGVLNRFADSFEEAVRKTSVPFMQRIADAYKGKSNQEVLEITRAIREGRIDNKDAEAVDELLGDLGDYLVDAKVLEEDDLRENYFPRVYNKELIQRDREGFEDAVASGLESDQGLSPEVAEEVARYVADLILHGDEKRLRDFIGRNPGLAKGVRLGPKNRPWYLNMRTLEIQDHFIEDYLVNDGRAVLTQYVMRAVQYAEFITRVGEDGGKSWLEDLEALGVRRDDQQVIANIMDAHKGVYELGSGAALQYYAGGFQNIIALTTLSFAGLASLSEFAVPIVRTGWKNGFAGIATGFMNKVREDPDARRYAEEIGVSLNAAIEWLWQEHLFGHQRPFSKWMGPFFVANLLSPITQIQREIATVASLHHVEDLLSEADLSASSRRELQRLYLPLDFQSRQEILNFAKRYVSLRGEDRAAFREENIELYEQHSTAIYRLVDQSVVMGTVGSKPLWGSSNNPAKRLAFMLSSFIHAFREKVLGFVIDEAKADISGGDYDELLALIFRLFPLIILQIMAITAREMIQYGPDEAIKRLEDKTSSPGEAGKFFFHAFDRAGLPGTFSKVLDAGKAQQYGVDALLYMGGPAAVRASDLLGGTLALFFQSDPKPLERVLAQSIPVAGQIKPVREAMQDYVTGPAAGAAAYVVGAPVRILEE